MDANPGSIEIEQHGDVTVVSLVGDHDIVTATDVRRELEQRSATADGLVVSLAKTEFFDSGIIHALFTADRTLRRRDRRLVLHAHTPSIVARALDISGLQHQLPCTSSFDEALTLALGQPSSA